MTHFKSMRTINKLVASLMVAAMFAAAFFVSSPAAKADDTNVGVTLTPGTPTVTSWGTWAFANISVGSSKTIHPVIAVTDPSGNTESVWNITGYIDADFVDTTTPAIKFPTSLTILAVTPSNANPVGHQNTPTYSTPAFIGAFSTSDLAPTDLLTISAGSALGQSTHTLDTNLSIPVYAQQGTYSATIHLTFSTGV